MSVKLEGLSEFQDNLGKLADDLDDATRLAADDAAELIADGARARMPSRSGRAKRSILVQASKSGAMVTGGSRSVAYFGWLEFGGRVGRNKSIRRPFISEGRYLLPARKREQGKIEAALSVRVAKAVGNARLS